MYKKIIIKNTQFFYSELCHFVQQAYVIHDYMYEMLNISETLTYKVNMMHDFI
jgi:hypothetical protein